MKQLRRFIRLGAAGAILGRTRYGLFATMFFLWPAFSMATSEVVISDDGRQIQLNGDGTWVQLSKDRYATNAAGQRLRLAADGTWSIVDSDKTLQGAPLTPITAANESTLFLAKVEILKRQIKRAKSVHAETVTVYQLQIKNDTDQTISLEGDLSQRFVASSSGGTEYPIESIEVDKPQVAPGERGNITLVALGSPRWFGTKYMALEVAANTLGNSEKRILSKSMNEVDKRTVDDI